MPPGLTESDFERTPTILKHTDSMEETSYFPPISRKSTLSVTSETDFRNDRMPLSSRGSIPSSVASSPVKFPTIDRSKSTSVSSLHNPVSHSRSHHRSRTRERESRAKFCRSPSCPSNLDFAKDNLDLSLFKRDSPGTSERTMPGSPTNTVKKDENMKLPSIFSKETSSLPKMDKHREIPTWKSDRNKGGANGLGLRRSDSFRHSFHASPDQTSRSQNGEANTQRSQTQALLLPIRTETRLKISHKKKKKSHTARSNTQVMFESGQDSPSQRVYDLYNTKNSDDALDAIARENGKDEMDKNVAIEIQSSRGVKHWMKDNSRGAQKEGQVKA